VCLLISLTKQETKGSLSRFLILENIPTTPLSSHAVCLQISFTKQEMQGGLGGTKQVYVQRRVSVVYLDSDIMVTQQQNQVRRSTRFKSGNLKLTRFTRGWRTA